MALQEMKDVIEENILRSMREYMTEDGADYTDSHINKCGRILKEFIDDLLKITGNKDKIMKAAEKAIVLLNDLNENVDYTLIETDQREDICNFILKAVNEAGLKTEKDITEEWRDW